MATPGDARRGAAADLNLGAPNRVPASFTSFVGRQRDLAQARRHLAQHRLVTLTGPGGIGKSRLARELCVSVPEDLGPDGVWMVELHGVAADGDVAEAVMVGLGLTAGRGAALDTVLDFVSGRTTVVALDNGEHLLPGLRALVTTLLRAAPGLRILVTSREPLGVFGEQVVPVAPLGLPPENHPVTPTEARRSEAVQLLETRATEVDPGFRLQADNVADAVAVCRRLDGVPLALELAAARLRTLGLPELVRRLDDRFALLSRGDPTAVAHHRTLRAMVAWSHDLCSPGEQRLWAELSVFAGGADLAAVAAVCGEMTDEAQLLDDLDALVTKSVLLAEPTALGLRYRMLETVREFGRDQLEAAGRTAELRSRHATHYAALARGFESGFFSPDQVRWIARVRDDRQNLGAAIQHLLREGGDGRAALALATDLRMHWISRAACEGRRWLGEALAANPGPTPARALGLATYAVLSAFLPDRAAGLLAEAEAIVTAVGTPVLRARFEDARAAVCVVQGDLGQAHAAGLRAVELAGAVGDVGTRLTGYSSVTIAAVLLRDPTARQTCWDMAAACEAVGDRWLQAWAHHHLAVDGHQRGDLADAGRQIDRCLELAYESANLVALAMVLVPAGRIALRRGQHQRAAQLLGAAFELSDEVGAGAEPLGTLAESVEQIRVQAIAALGEQRFRRAFEQGAGWPLARLVGTAMSAAAAEAVAATDAGGLSAREWDVVRLVAQGKTNRAIALDLHLSPRTVEGHVERILAKRGFHRRTEIAIWATQHLDEVARR